MRSEYTSRLTIGVALLVVVTTVSGGLWLFSRQAPEAVRLDAAVEALEAASADAIADASAPAANDAVRAEPETPAFEASAPMAAFDGVWTVDPTIGTYSYDDPTASFVGVRVREQLAGVGLNTAVLRTPRVAGSLAIEDGILVAARFDVDVASLTSDDSHHDSHVVDAIDSATHPIATFTLTRAARLDRFIDVDGRLHVDAEGELTIGGVTRPVTVPLAGQVVGETVVVVGGTEITFSDFDVVAPTSSVALSVDDAGFLEIQLIFAAGEADPDAPILPEPLPTSPDHDH